MVGTLSYPFFEHHDTDEVRSLGVRANGDLGKGQDLIFVLRTARLDRVSVTSRTLRRTNLFYSDRTDRASRMTWRHDINST
jgi:hypothetical protein